MKESATFISNLDRIKEKEEDSKKKIAAATNSVKSRQQKRKEDNEKELKNYQLALKQELDAKLKQLESMDADLEIAKAKEEKEKEEVKLIVAANQENIIEFITKQILDVDLSLPEVLKPRVLTKKKK